MWEFVEFVRRAMADREFARTEGSMFGDGAFYLFGLEGRT
jgi:hypothetical protein